MATVRRSRSGDTHSYEVGSEGKTTQRYGQTWIVELGPSDPAEVSGVEVRSLPGLPRPGQSTYSPRPGRIVPFALCRSAVPTPHPKNRRLWYVKCTFELLGSDEEDKDDKADPGSLAPKIEPFCDSTESIMEVDFDNRPILDPKKNLFTKSVMVKVPLPGVRVTRYVSEFDEQTLAYWKFCTNKEEWRGQPVDAWYIRQVTGKMVQFGDFEIGQLQFDIVSNPLEMELPKADGTEGTELRRYGWLHTFATKSEVFDDDNGKECVARVPEEAVRKTVWLKPDGTKSDEPFYMAFRVARQRDFNEIVKQP